MKPVWKAWATFFGLGSFPVAPGTLTSLVVTLLYKLFLHKTPWFLYLFLILVVFTSGWMAADRFSRELKAKDPRKIVMDEACGQLIALFQIPGNWSLLIVNFFLFRLFDVVKPFPIKKIEHLPGGLGIMGDDIMAAIYAGGLLHLWLLIR